MNYKHTIFPFVLIALIAVNLPAQVIQQPAKRSELLKNLHGVVANRESKAVDYSMVVCPFYEPIIQEAPTIAPGAGEKKEIRVVEDVPTAILPDETALRLIARQFKPLGSMVMGNQGYLQLGQGQTMKEGSSFKAEIKEHVYEVFVSSVTERDYTLKLGQARIIQTFIKAGASQ